jgi:LmbE family N-acetylglucosaminyl deacetylase
MRFAADAPAVVLSPHPDDAVLSCWSVLGGDGDVTVLNVFDAVPPAGSVTRWELITGFTDSAAAMRHRRSEDAGALALAGRHPVSLGFHDEQHRRAAPRPRSLRRALERAAPVASVVYAPAAIGGHADHRLAASAALPLRFDGVPVRLYADVPYAIEYGWPHWVTGAERDPRVDPDAMWEPFLEDLPWHRVLLKAEAVTLDEARSTAKLAAMRAYDSQFPALDAAPVGRLSSPAIHGHEVFWTVLPWTRPTLRARLRIGTRLRSVGARRR